MPTLRINPRFCDRIAALGLTTVNHFLSLQGLIISGHTDRHVVRVTLGGQTAYLKREHRVRLGDRLGSTLAGFGWVSMSLREAELLTELRRAGLGAPDWIAAGEDDRGRAFVLVEELPEVVDLREMIDQLSAGDRRRLAQSLGRALAAYHEAGFDQPDLYAKHILVHPHTLAIHLIDWQRSRRSGRITARRVVRDLAALDATLPAETVTDRERVACLRAYARARLDLRDKRSVKSLSQNIRAAALRLLSRSRVRREREKRSTSSSEGILWLEGEALCLTSDFWDTMRGNIPEWLRADVCGSGQTVVDLPHGERGLLVRRSENRPIAWLHAVLRGRTLTSPEVRQAGVYFARVKHGQPAPRVLAFGQHRPWPWRIESFLLTAVTEEGRSR